MAHVVMYTTATCPYCVAAERLLSARGVTDIQKLRVDLDPALRTEMLGRSGGRRSVPQIFIDDFHVGGFDDLSALDHAGRLDPLLQGTPPEAHP
jgi:glutaredoxin 3